MTKTFSIQRHFIEVKEDLFEVLKVIKDTPKVDMEAWKGFYGADTAFRRDGQLFLVRKIEEAEIVEDEPKLLENEHKEE